MTKNDYKDLSLNYSNSKKCVKCGVLLTEAEEKNGEDLCFVCGEYKLCSSCGTVKTKNDLCFTCGG